MLEGVEDKSWDRHSSVNTQALSLWFMTDEDQDREMRQKFEILFQSIDTIMYSKLPPTPTPQPPIPQPTPAPEADLKKRTTDKEPQEEDKEKSKEDDIEIDGEDKRDKAADGGSEAGSNIPEEIMD